MLSFTQIFILFFVMFGPLRLIGPFTQSTQHLSFEELKKITKSASLIATTCLVLSGLFGSMILQKWQIDEPTMMLAGGIVFFITALKILITPTKQSENKELIRQTPSASDFALNTELTPYGIAAVIVLFSTTLEFKRSIIILSCLLIVMILNALSMLYGRQILKLIGILPIKIIGLVIGVLQLGLATQIIINSLRKISDLILS